MKKFLVTILAAFMVCAVAGSAAAFSNGDLTLVLYNPDDTEVAFNLGQVSGIDFGQANVELQTGISGYSFLDDMAGTSILDDVKVGMISSNNATFSSMFSSTLADDAYTVALTTLSVFGNAVTDLYNNTYGPTTDKYVGDPKTNQFHAWMNENGNAMGSYQGLNGAPDRTKAVGTFTNGVAEIYLYEISVDFGTFEVVNVKGTGVNAGLDHIAKISIYEDGRVVLNEGASPVPVPGAVVLLGSGLLGLVGIRRRK